MPGLPTTRPNAHLPDQADPTAGLPAELLYPPVADGAGRITGTIALQQMQEAEDTLRAIAAGEVDAFVITDGKAARRVFTLSTADRPYRIFVESMREGAATLSANGIVLYANRRLAEILATPLEILIGSPLGRYIAGKTRIGWETLMGPGGGGTTVEFEVVGEYGVPIPVLVGTAPLEVDGVHLICLTFTDLTAQKAHEGAIAQLNEDQAERMVELQKAQAALTVQTTHDALTGLPNRVLVVDRIQQALARSERSGERIAVFFVDLDGFKQVNDTRGHHAGDDLLRSVAQHLVAVTRPMDTVARIGGDEFVVLATDVDSQLHAVDIGLRLINGRSRPADNAGPCEFVASVGISVSAGGRGPAEELLKEADTAMYRAKSLGGGRAEVFEAALGHQSQQRSRTLLTLQGALDAGRLIVNYQPILDIASNRLAGFEALARIAELDGSTLWPTDFIRVAEDSGLVTRLGSQVLASACREARRWQPLPLPKRQISVAVNLSARQFESGNLTTIVEQSLRESGPEASALHFELTESGLVDLQPDTLRQLGHLRDLGVEIGLDDFGTGYASLTHLRQLPLSFVKIDQSFVQRMEADSQDDRIVAAVVDLAANLGLRSIAEGVETDYQLARLRELGCDQAQGYLFARPLPPEQVAAAIHQSAWPSGYAMAALEAEPDMAMPANGNSLNINGGMERIQSE